MAKYCVPQFRGLRPLRSRWSLPLDARTSSRQGLVTDLRGTCTKHVSALHPAALLPFTLLFGCAQPEPTAPPEPTFWRDVAPITAAKCVGCHQEGGIAHFPLDDYEHAKARAGAIDDAVQGGHMPPFLVTHDGSCGDFQDDATLTTEELDILHRWATGARAEGDPADAPTSPPIPELEGATEYQTPLITPVVDPSDPLAAHDEYRCFPVDPGITSDQFITGYQVTPGNPTIVHHAAVYMVTASAASYVEGKTNQDLMDEYDQASPGRPGWDCFGGPGDALVHRAIPVIWAPGQGVIEYPGGSGVQITPEDRLVIQIHYNLHDHAGAGATDSTRVRLRYADAVQRPAVFISYDGLLFSVFNPEGPDSLPPGQKDAAYTWSQTRAELELDPALPPLEVLGVMPHMHERGRTYTLHAKSGARDDCITRVNDWDVHWQGMYWYRTPPMLDASSSLELTCTYDTSDAESPVLPGWGTQNEMCTASLLVALPPAP